MTFSRAADDDAGNGTYGASTKEIPLPNFGSEIIDFFKGQVGSKVAAWAIGCTPLPSGC